MCIRDRANTTPCHHCMDPLYSIVIFGLSTALISPSVNPSIPLVASKDRLAFVFSLFRALSAASGGIFILLLGIVQAKTCLLYTSPSPRDQRGSRMPSSA
eukprot:TRINITY_DN12544_c0_g1_i1.p2 TRINITY_DN12544_c0_g1~~TRINITY_DN12544_c0_g1_i1.p2  ORF type:complete len:116 (-),score=46.93 TRINITY_DN12544_c0_g1_i1:11-310(-)